MVKLVMNKRMHASDNEQGINKLQPKVFSFWIQKFSCCIKHFHKMYLELEVLTSLSIIINLAWLLLKLWPCC